MGKRFSLITATRDPEHSRLGWLRRQHGPDTEVLVVANPGTTGLGQAYNDGLLAATGEYCCFLHDDVLVDSLEWRERLAAAMVRHGYDLLGAAGATAAPRNGAWWNAGVGATRGSVQHESPDGRRETMRFGPPDDPESGLSEVLTLDGILLFGRREHFLADPFDTELFDGFHFYDSDLCLRWRLWRGRRIGVLDGLGVVHRQGTRLEGWQQYLDRFHYRHGGFLPADLSRVSTWRKNYAAIAAREPRTANLLVALRRPGEILGFAESGDDAVLARTAAGEVVFRDGSGPLPDEPVTVVLGAGTGWRIEELLSEPGARLLVIEPEGQLVCWLLCRFDWSEAIAAGRLDFWMPPLDLPEMAAVSALESALGLEMLARGRGFQCVRTGSARFHESFFGSLERWLERCRRRSAPFTPFGASAFDVTVISPRCKIMDDLAQSFARLGARTRRIEIPDRPAEITPEDRSNVLAELRDRPSRLVIQRNRVLLETDRIEERMPSSEFAPLRILSWWWDVPNVASLLDLVDSQAAEAGLAVAKETLSLLPEGSIWLPAGARSAFAEAPIESALAGGRELGPTFVGQSRFGFLQSSLNVLASAFAYYIGRTGLALADDLNRARGMRAIHDLLVQARPELLAVLAKLGESMPPHAYYLRYLLDASESAAFRLAAIESLAPLGIAVYGDEGWIASGAVERDRFGGLVAPESLPGLYARSRLNLNLSFFQIASGVHPKVLDLAALGAELLTDDRPELAELFPDPAIRPTAFGSLAELPDVARDLAERNDAEVRRRRAEFVRSSQTLFERARTILAAWSIGA